MSGDRRAEDHPWGRTLHYGADLDEISVQDVEQVHLERMDDNIWSLIVTRQNGERIGIDIRAKRAPVHAYLREWPRSTSTPREDQHMTPKCGISSGGS